MSLYSEWLEQAYTKEGQAQKKLWDRYLPLEQQIYEEILEGKITNIHGTVEHLARRYNMPKHYVLGFIDGLNEVIPEKLDLETLDEETEVNLDIDFEKLFKTMVLYKADHLYELPQWDNIFSPEHRKAFFVEAKKTNTFVRQEAKVGRNDPCPCGSGKKYKNCCGKHKVS